MSVKRNAFANPTTVAGLVLGLILGGMAVAKEIFDNRFPKVGLAILFLTPVAGFLFDQVMLRAFPEAYWEQVAGRLLFAYRYILNEGFCLRFFYEMRFVVDDNSPSPITPELISNAVRAVPGGDPEPSVSGSNYVHLRFRDSPYLISIVWHLEEPEDETGDKDKSVFRLTMEPEIKDLVMRRAKNDIDFLVARLNRLHSSLVELFRAQAETQAVVDAWLGHSVPPANPIDRVRTDRISGATYRIFPGLLRITGEDLSALGAVYRYVGTLKEPPESS